MYTTAFFYGANLPIDQLATFQRVVVEPENTLASELIYLKDKGVGVYAYLSIGEVYQDTSWLKECDKSWILGTNNGWDTQVMDMSNSEWSDFLLHKRVSELWHKGYQGFFLDTMDSYKLFTKTPNNLLAQELGIITLIRSITQTYSGVHLLFNRGFEVLNEIGNLVDGVVAESLFSSWNPIISNYQEVSPEDHQWLLEKLILVQDQFKLPITVIDYLPEDQQEQGKKIAKKIVNLGFSPWISTMALNTIGINTQGI